MPSETSWGGSEGAPRPPPPPHPTTFDPFEGVTLPPLCAVRTLYLQEGKANSLASPRRHRGTPGVT